MQNKNKCFSSCYNWGNRLIVFLLGITTLRHLRNTLRTFWGIPRGTVWKKDCCHYPNHMEKNIFDHKKYARMEINMMLENNLSVHLLESYHQKPHAR